MGILNNIFKKDSEETDFLNNDENSKILKYYYRLNGLGIDIFDKKAVIKYNQVLNSYEDLSEPFEGLKKSYENSREERADIMVCVLPHNAETYLNGIVELNVYHKTKDKPFFGKRTENIFSLCTTKITATGAELYDYETTNFHEVKSLFYEYIVRQRIPDLSSWKKTVI